MCGVFGVVSNTKINREEFSKAAGEQFHRGPDDQSELFLNFKELDLGLAHQRLSIFDLSDASNQPFHYKETHLIFNGEIYNFPEIRSELQAKGVAFESRGDTEVLIKAIYHYGIDRCLKLLNGMWAFCYFNEASGELYLARDRFGIKPLYYFIEDHQLIFASEIKSILSYSSRKFSLNKNSIRQYIDQHLLDAEPEESFFTDIHQVAPSQYIQFDLMAKHWKTPEKKNYYDLESKIKNVEPVIKPEEVYSIFSSAVDFRLRSDVAVGVLLSGGVDSSAIAAITNKLNRKDIRFLSFVSDDPKASEEKYIDIVSKHLETEVEKVKIKIDPNSTIDLIKKCIHHNDGPIHSFSALAHFLLMQKAKEKGLTVILSGQGADELLCGYPKFLGQYLKQMLANFKFVRFLKVFLQFFFNSNIFRDFNFGHARRYLPVFFQSKSVLSQEFTAKTMTQFLGTHKEEDFRNRQIRDIKRFSVPSLLHYEDRMSMAHSREIRVPFLDHRVVESYIALPIEKKLYQGWTKYIFRKAFSKDLPTCIIWRKDKKGFTHPGETWLRGPLAASLEQYLKSDLYIYRANIIDSKKMLEKWYQFQNQKKNISEREIFSPISLSLWLDSVQEKVQD